MFGLFPRPELVSEARSALRRPGEVTVLSGLARSGRSTVLGLAAQNAREDDRRVAVASLRGASVLVDVATRVASAVVTELESNAADLVGRLARLVGTRIALEVGESGTPSMGFDHKLRSRSHEEQREILDGAVRWTAELAREQPLSLVLDDVDEAEQAPAREIVALFRDAAGGSQLSIVSSVAGHPANDVGPDTTAIDVAALAKWLDDSFRSWGVKPQGAGQKLTSLGGPCIGDVLMLARYCLEIVRKRGFVGPEDATAAFRMAVTDQAAQISPLWRSLTQHQQNTLRAIAARSRGLTTAAVRERFGLGDTGTTHNTATLLVKKGVIRRAEPGYTFCSPFVRGWVLEHTLRDVGIELPITHLPHEGP